MKFKHLFVQKWLLAIFVCITVSCGQAAPIHVLPLGDSITQGGRADREEYTYRYPLFYKLKDAGYNVDFIGSLNAGLSGDAKWPDKNGVAFDPDHEGHYGWKTGAVRDKIREWSTDWKGTPDIVLIHLGTNDQSSTDFNADIVHPLKEIIAFLREKNPRVAVLVGHLNFNGGPAAQIRPLVAAMAMELSTADSPVVTVNHFEGWVENPDAPGADTFDWAHPNPQGQEKMAAKWFAAMQPILKKFSASSASTSSSTPSAVGAMTQNTAAQSATWAFALTPAKTTGAPLLNLRSLNEKIAGQSGFVRRSKDGSDFVDGRGKPLRFFAAGVGSSIPDMDAHARFLAGLGVNLARLLCNLPPAAPNSRITDINEKEIDRIWKTVAALKKQGIYTEIQPFWAYADYIKNIDAWGLEGYSGNEGLFGVIFFNEELQKGYKAWTKALYARVNPYTGLRLADDPSVSFIEIHHEDSALFWTLDALKPVQKQKASTLFGRWLLKKYGSLDAAKTAWGNAVVADDDFAAGRPQLLPMFELTTAQSGDKEKRVCDQTQFLGETQRDFYGMMRKYLRDELGCKQLISSSNWRTADPVRLGDIERWSYTANDVVASNIYYTTLHNGPNASWRSDPGDVYQSQSVLKQPRVFPGVVKQVAGHPFVITETNYVSPNDYQTEAPFLAMAYKSLTGVDAWCWFQSTANDYDQNPYFPWAKVENQFPLMTNWTISTPNIQAMFPAAAIAFRKGYIRRGATVVHEERSLDDLWNRRLPLIAEQGAFDPVRDSKDTRGAAKPKTVADPLAFLTGPVEVKYGADSRKNRVADISKLHDATRKIIRSNTGEIVWNYGAGVCTVNAPRVQGAAGFLKKAGVIKLGAAHIASTNDYAAITLVALDDKPLQTSKRVLVQVGTQAFPTGWKTEPATLKSDSGATIQGQKVVFTGAMPWQVVNTAMRLSLDNSVLKSARLLNPDFTPMRAVTVKRAGKRLSLTLPSDTMYLILE